MISPGLEVLLAVVMLGALIAYALLGCADFGGGIWDLLSGGPRRAEQREAIARAIGPVWEANHVWLIFLIVLMFTCFPRAFAAASVALFWPLHLILAGIVLRGSSFVFRAYHAKTEETQRLWSRLFGAASAFTPVLLGACLGAVSSGAIRVEGGGVTAGTDAWLSPFSLATGLMACLLSAYLAAVYLAWESRGAVRNDFLRRALLTWLAAGVMSLALLPLAASQAPALWQGLTRFPAIVAVGAGVALAPLSAIALMRHWFGAARVMAAAQVFLLLAGWALAQYPFLIAPDLTIANSAAPEPTLALTALTLPLGAALLVPSLWYLFAVFKGQNPAHPIKNPDSP